VNCSWFNSSLRLTWQIIPQKRINCHSRSLQPFVEEIKNFETNGVKIKDDKTIYGTLVSTTFDNLGGNSMLGFAESFSATYCCRFCTIEKSLRKESWQEDVSK
jgi:hypothetical protein